MSGIPEVIDPRVKQYSLEGYWHPGLLGLVNNTAIKLAKIHGEFVWHSHADEDELFMVIEGSMRLEFREGSRTLLPGEMIIVPRGVEHRPVAEEPCLILLVEPTSTINTGDMESVLRRETLKLL